MSIRVRAGARSSATSDKGNAAEHRFFTAVEFALWVLGVPTATSIYVCREVDAGSSTKAARFEVICLPSSSRWRPPGSGGAAATAHDSTHGQALSLERAALVALLNVAGFFAGCVAGAAAVSLMGRWAWSLPVILAAAAVQVPKR